MTPRFVILLCALLTGACGQTASAPSADDETPSDTAPADAGQGGAAPDARTLDGAETADRIEASAEASVDFGPSCATWAAAACGKRRACKPSSIDIFWGDLDTCTRVQAESCTRWAAAPGSSWTRNALEACATAETASTCQAWSDGPTDDCSHAGSLADNAPCAFGSQCRGGFCRIDFEQTCGVCGGPRVVWDACPNGCGPGMRCNNNNQCVVAGVKEGDACDAAHWCGFGLICYLASATATAGQCGPLPAIEGAACEPAKAGCDTDHTDLTCDSATSTCLPMTLAELGQACSPMKLCRNGYCNRTCAAWHQENESCSDAMPCADGVACVPDGTRKTCKRRDAALCR